MIFVPNTYVSEDDLKKRCEKIRVDIEERRVMALLSGKTLYVKNYINKLYKVENIYSDRVRVIPVETFDKLTSIIYFNDIIGYYTA